MAVSVVLLINILGRIIIGSGSNTASTDRVLLLALFEDRH